MRKNLLYATILIILSFSFIFVLQIFIEKKESNGFSRRMRSQNLEMVKVLDLPPSLYFAGVSKLGFYLKDLNNANYLYTSYLYTIDDSLDQLTRLDLNLSMDSNIRKSKINIGVQNSSIYLTNRSGDLRIISQKTGKKYTFANAGMQFDQSNLLSKKSIAVRENFLNGDQLQRRLTKFDYMDNKIEKTYPLKKQVDGFFCTDGLLQLDPRNSRFVYAYFYRGEFLCLDTNLNLLYKAKTIDTITTAKFKAAKLIKNAANHKGWLP